MITINTDMMRMIGMKTSCPTFVDFWRRRRRRRRRSS
jgi:hypothetical protein